MNKKKLIILKKDTDKEFPNKCYVRFLDKDKTLAMFFEPLIGPKYLSEYIRANNIEEAYEITNHNDILDNSMNIYTFRFNKGIYDVSKGVELDRKLAIFMDDNLDFLLDLPKYSFTLDKNVVITKPYKKGLECCYIDVEDNINEKLAKYMTPLYEASTNTYFLTNEIIKIYDPKKIKKKEKK